jgi:thioredoxin-dependent peroxiredoxin
MTSPRPPGDTQRRVESTLRASAFLVLVALGAVGSAPGCTGRSDQQSVAVPADTVGKPPSKPTSIPAFAARASDGSVRGRADLVGHPTVLWFYLLAGTVEDTTEARAFAEKSADWDALGVHVVGVGFDDPEKTRNWGHNEKLPFELWTDDDHVLANTLGAAANPYAILPTRTTVLVDPAGNVLLRYDGSIDPSKHPADVLADAQKVLKKP